ncbi:MAG: hypothetical protein ACOCWS_03630 [Alkalispirochaetaceae bacterium]
MLALRRRALIMHTAITIALLAGLAVFGYLTIRGLPESKAAAERFLMTGVLLALLSLIGVVVIFRRANDLNRILYRAEQRLRQGGFSSKEYFISRQLGDLGRQLSGIYESLEEISEKKSLRIGALGVLNQFILQRSDERLLVINGAGQVFQVTQPFLDTLEQKRPDVIGVDVTRILPEFDLDSMIAHFYREGTVFEVGEKKERLRVYPVFDSAGQLAYAVVVFGEAREVALPIPTVPPTAPGRPEKRGIFRRSLDWVIRRDGEE